MFRSFCLTVRPREGICDNTIEQIKKWLHKCDHAFAVLEKSDNERHMHAQVWFEKGKARGDVCKQVQRICERTIEEWDTAQLKILRQGVKIAYSDWYLDYLAENESKDAPNILVENVPGKTMGYYPTEEEQDRVKTVNTAVDPRFAKLELDYISQYSENPVTLDSVACFLCNEMFVNRTLKVVIHQRDRIALAQSLYAYISKDIDKYLFLNKTKELNKYEKLLSSYNLQNGPDSQRETYPSSSSKTESEETD